MKVKESGSLQTRLADNFEEEVQDRGRQCYFTGAVDIVSHSGTTVIAAVHGRTYYDVKLELAKRELRAYCSCSYYQRNYECKHIWATILTVDAKGILRPPSARLAYEPMDDFDGFGASYDDDEWSHDTFIDAPEPSRARPQRRKSSPARWKQIFSAWQAFHAEPPPAGLEILYVIDAEASASEAKLVLQVVHRRLKMNGTPSKPITQRRTIHLLRDLSDPIDRRILTVLQGAPQNYSGYGYYSSYDEGSDHFVLGSRRDVPRALHAELWPLFVLKGRVWLRSREKELDELICDSEPWQLWLRGVRDPSKQRYLIDGQLRRSEERLDLTAVNLAVPGLVIWQGRAAPLTAPTAIDWLGLLRDTIAVPEKDQEQFLSRLYECPDLPPLDLPAELQLERVTLPPQPRLKVCKNKQTYYGRRERLRGELAFDYGGVLVPAEQPGTAVAQLKERRLIGREPTAEAAALERLRQLGFQSRRDYGAAAALELLPRHLPRVVQTLLAEGWHVEAEGNLYRRASNFHMEVQSGIDWFELHGKVEFGETSAELPALLAALKRGETTVRLGDGSYGMLPEEWLRKYASIAGMGTVQGDHVRFTPTQVGLLDALLAARPEINADERFSRARQELRRFSGIEPADPTPEFTGTLRGYQRDGLGWMHFLRRFGFGGCLADDMGLGKTVMVLALLEARRVEKTKEPRRPSLVVVPRSLIFNWAQEAARFAPRLRLLDHTGLERRQPGSHFNDYDLVMTTYGTLRRDAAQLRAVPFDYCILDEAQAAKNASTDTAKAVRLIDCRHRLALSGTPVENHLGELWTMFDFLNPGMLGQTPAFAGGNLRNPDEETRALLARALRPFILRRTKEQVVRDLPAKTEQTIYCDLEPGQRKLYDDLRRHYRQELLARIDRDGIKKSAIQVLEALLRLRQAACHPGLIDKARDGHASAKLDTLCEQLTEVLEEGHKALVFSQFTSFLALLRQRLDKDKVRYEYLDGRTRDRQARVEQFQTDPASKLFLISLKAGGLGLNLTAAEYVFLLDPWWNPAVEAQAVDRAHRIGQTKPVFAYRLIARDTVEEKVLQLQQHKRALADAIIGEDNSLIRNLTREDLNLLLS
jgi:superfamily II DNA or RNA helicase